MSRDGSGTYTQPPTRPLPRAVLAPIASRPAPMTDEDTLVPCPVCKGARLVHPDIAALIHRLLKAAEDNG